MKKFTAILFLSLLFGACQNLKKPEISEEELLQQELKKINWTQVDEFPSVATCDSIKDDSVRKQCFFDFLTITIQQKLDLDTLSILYPQIDTIQVKVTVFPDSRLEFEPQFPSDSLAYDKIKIDSILHARLTDFPKINPALKRGIPVKTQFVLPVILNVE
ncbi:hypothetical protein [Flavobacterium macacae]|uniref:Uncharacterized protein n=1 Tax=Flavobacterium macacae TaxID=2488993 RepID=A0A3P3WIG2_9FLAO|nr:hypothetical protein [Flavobacterium macacae]RRJ93809.1 hypothetical protein EG849_02940 [Flavobacterium macacae]